jgi:hypothetical protein
MALGETGRKSSAESKRLARESALRRRSEREQKRPAEFVADGAAQIYRSPSLTLLASAAGPRLLTRSKSSEDFFNSTSPPNSLENLAAAPGKSAMLQAAWANAKVPPPCTAGLAGVATAAGAPASRLVATVSSPPTLPSRAAMLPVMEVEAPPPPPPPAADLRAAVRWCAAANLEGEPDEQPTRARPLWVVYNHGAREGQWREVYPFADPGSAAPWSGTDAFFRALERADYKRRPAWTRAFCHSPAPTLFCMDHPYRDNR